MRQATIILQITDPHVDGYALDAGRRDTGAMLRAAIEALKDLCPVPDRWLVTGDLAAMKGLPADYSLLKSCLEAAHAPVRLMPGNHDERGALEAAFPDQLWRDRGASEHLSWVETVEGRGGAMRVVGLDSHGGRGVMGGFGARRQEWLKWILAEDTETPTLLAMHHPPFNTGDPKADTLSLPPKQVAALADILRANPQVQRVVSGHLHRLAVGEIGGVAAMVCPSTCWQFGLSPGLERELGETNEAAGALMHVLTPGNRISSIHVNLGQSPFKP
jgi:3',5'-cyclic-AMP phosphodiesterase